MYWSHLPDSWERQFFLSCAYPERDALRRAFFVPPGRVRDLPGYAHARAAAEAHPTFTQILETSCSHSSHLKTVFYKEQGLLVCVEGWYNGHTKISYVVLSIYVGAVDVTHPESAGYQFEVGGRIDLVRQFVTKTNSVGIVTHEFGPGWDFPRRVFVVINKNTTDFRQLD